MRAAHIEEGKVVNIIEVDSLDAMPGYHLVPALSAEIGDGWDGGNFIRPPLPEPNIAAIKEARNADINRWRAEANALTFTHAGKVIACDALSRSDIDAVAGSIALTGEFPAGFPGAWKAVDNTYIPLPTVGAFKAMYNSMTAQGTANFGHSQALKAALAAATTPAEIDAIVW